jgi:transcriptional regulator with XRE-family HTH domain
MGFKENLKAELEYKGMLVKELAAASGVNRRTIDNYLSSHNCMPSADAAVKIAMVLGVSAEYLVNGGEPQKAKAAERCGSYGRALLRILDELDDEDKETLLGIAGLIKQNAEKKRSRDFRPGKK